MTNRARQRVLHRILPKRRGTRCPVSQRDTEPLPEKAGLFEPYRVACDMLIVPQKYANHVSCMGSGVVLCTRAILRRTELHG